MRIAGKSHRTVSPWALAAVFVPHICGAVEFRSYFIVDVLNSPVASTDEYANTTWNEDYLPYGQRILETSAASRDGDNERWFTGAPQSGITGLIDLGNRYYDPVVGRFLSMDIVGVDFADGRNFNRYWYARNSPYVLTDPNGRWASKWGFFVHQQATNRALEDRVPSWYLRFITAAHEFADSDQFQGPDSSYRHAMRNGDQTAEQARAMANEFVRQEFQTAWDFQKNDDWRRAMFHFGIALHALQDSTSPAHAGFQPWTGHETGKEKRHHVYQEYSNPGEGSELYEITRDAWRWFSEGKLPDGDLFTRGPDD